MKQIDYDALVESVKSGLIKASSHLEPSLMDSLSSMKNSYEKSLRTTVPDSKEYEQQKASLLVLTMILKNLEISALNKVPMCQDTGMIIAFADIGPDANFTLSEIERAITDGSRVAIDEGNFRHSIVGEPLFQRVNTLSNLPFIIHYSSMKKGSLSLHFLLKGFGSENCSATKMLNPTTTPSEVIDEIIEMVKTAGGKPCPPIVVGVGLGGSAEMSAILAKRALLRDVGTYNTQHEYRDLEKELLLKLQTTNIGPGGFGGPLTALWASVEYMATHIAGLPLSVAISCWADRKAHIYL